MKDKKELLNEIILGYRNLIKEKYSYKNLKKRNDLPKAYDEEIGTKIKDYFLNYSYPTVDKRKDLDKAFQSLDNYLKTPEKLLRIVIDSTSIIFKYGKDLPKILNAGVKTLKAFRRASKLEQELANKALFLKKEPPFSPDEINDFLSHLDQKQIEEYIKSTYDLFDILCDTVLVSKIKKILEHLINKMKNRPKIYTSEEIKGLEIGKEIIVEADLIFNKLQKNQQREIFDFIIKMEKEILDI